MDAVPSSCEVFGCDRPAADAYLHAVDARLVEFSICTGHNGELLTGTAPRVVTELIDLDPVAGRLVLVLAPPQDLDGG